MTREQRTAGLARYRLVPALALAFLAGAAAMVYGFQRIGNRIVPEEDRSLRAVLPRADWVQVIRAQPKIELFVAHFGPGADEDPEVFARFLTGTSFDAPPPSTAPDLYFNVRFHSRGAEHGRMTRYGYDLQTGRLGRDDDWAQTSEGFQKWIREADARLHHEDYGFMRSGGRKVIAPMPDAPEGSTIP